MLGEVGEHSRRDQQLVAGHWQFLDRADAMVTVSAELSEFRNTGVPTEPPAIPNSFVKET